MIEISKLTKTYKRGHKALDGLDLTINTGMFGLLGPNGAGKTTLMRIIATLLDPSSGKVEIFGHDVRTEKRAIRKMLGYLPQDFGIYPNLTAFEFLDYLWLISSNGDSAKFGRREHIYSALELVGLTKNAEQRLSTFSGGMKRRLGISQALLRNPRLLVVDEPTAGLDPEERIRFRNLLSELGQDRVVLLSTHIVEDITLSCSAAAIIKNGKLLVQAAPQAIINRVRGLVREVVIPEAEFNDLKSAQTIVSSVRSEDGLRVRLISRDAIGIEVAPSFEDAYLFLMQNQGGVKNEHDLENCQI